MIGRPLISRNARRAGFALAAGLCLALASCKGSGGGGGNAAGGGGGGGGGGGNTGLTTIGPFQAVLQRRLTVADVQTIISQAVAEAQARNARATIAVVDRVGNVLAVFRMNGAGATVTIRSGSGRNTGLQGLDIIPSTLAAISKAITGAYLSSAGNAFSTRTASFIIHETFPPGRTAPGLESGPLFGVQFSSLPCSDFIVRFQSNSGGTVNGTIGPKRAPLGLSADPGGLPLYKDGVLVGGVGVIADGIYGADPEPILNIDTDLDELIAVAAEVGFAPSNAIRADRIPVDGTTLKFIDRGTEALRSDPAAAPAFGAINGVVGRLVGVTGYHPGGAVRVGQAFGSEASGVRRARAGEFANTEMFVFTNGAGANRFPPRAGTDGAGALTANEVRRLLIEAFGVARAGRAQIRRPLNSRIQVTISVVDTNGVILGMARTPDAPIFGSDVSLQKARTAAFVSGPNARANLQAAAAALNGSAFNLGPVDAASGLGTAADQIRAHVQRTINFFNDPNALTGRFAFADRSGGNISRPFFPDGQIGAPPGPLSLAIANFNIFSTGLQEALIRANVVQHVFFTNGAAADTPPRCTTLPNTTFPAVNRLANGLQIFPGSVPIYRNGQLVGGIGVSGDGIDQDDMISFLGLDRAGTALAGAIANAPAAIRADQLQVNGVRLRYVNCPFNPFVGSSQQNVCQGR